MRQTEERQCYVLDQLLTLGKAENLMKALS